jgi:hypothetical protein
MAPLDEDDFRDEVLEIKDRIVEEHHRGGHVTGPVAGCAICAALMAAAEEGRARPEKYGHPEGEVASLPTSLEELARLRLAAGMQAPNTDDYEDEDEPGLIELAMLDGTQALTDAMMGKHGQATVTATVGVIRALAAIDDTLRTILAAILDDGVRAGDELDAERPERPDDDAGPDPAPVPGPVEDDDEASEARIMRATRLAREGLPKEPDAA